MSDETYGVAVVGATGLVGSEIVNALVEREFPLGTLALYASERTAGDAVTVGGLHLTVQLLDRADFHNVAIAFFAATETVSAAWVGRATAAGATVIDLSKLYAADPEVPLVVPQVNADALADYVGRRIIASPDAAAVQLAVVLRPLREAAGLKRVIVSSYEPVSQIGRAGVDELSQQTIALLNGNDIDVRTFPQRIAFNLLPQVGEFLDGGSTRAEQELIHQTRRLLDDDRLSIAATSVRVPLFYGLSQSVNVETLEPLSAGDARVLLGEAGLLIQDDPASNLYPTPMTTVGSDVITVGRIRDDESSDSAINLWISGDNLRSGSTLNAVAIAELLVRDYF